MRLFGILLVILCLAAGGAYVYFGVQDWKGRQNITAAMFRHLLMVQGLPLDGPDTFAADDETAFEIRMAGGQTSKTVSKKLLEKYFQENTSVAAAPKEGEVPDPMALLRKALATNEPVLNQAAELKRVRALLKAEFSGAENRLQRAAFVSYRLLLQAETLNERLEYQRLASQAAEEEKVDDKGERSVVTRVKTDAEFDADIAELVHRLDRRFYRVAPKLYEGAAAGEALDSDKWADLQKRIEGAEADAAAKLKPPVAADDGERHERLAHLLVHLDLDQAWQKRVAVVVGLRRYAPAVAAQAVRFAQMRQQIDQPIYSDQAAFQKHHDALQAEANQLVTRRNDTAAARANLEIEKNSADDAVGVRNRQLQELEALLKKVQDEVDRLLVEQGGIEKELFEIQREVGLTLEEVYRLEEELAKVERRRYGLSPGPARP